MLILKKSIKAPESTCLKGFQAQALKCLPHVCYMYMYIMSFLFTGKADSWWIKDLNLYIADKNHLESGSEVSDNVINAAHTLLSQQFPHIHGFQNTLLGYRLKFKVVPRIPSVQILHTGTVMCVNKLSSKVNNTLSEQKSV